MKKRQCFNKKLIVLYTLISFNLSLHAEYSFADIGLERIKAFLNKNSLASEQTSTNDPTTDPNNEWEIAERKIVYKLFDQRSDKETAVADGNLGKELEILCGNGAPEENLLNKINKSTTLFGEAMFAHALLNPQTSLEVLKKRRAAVQELVNNPKLFAAVEQEINAIKAVQSTILSYWPASNHPEHSMVYFTVPFRKNLRILNWLNTKLNTNTPVLELSNIKKTVTTASQILPVFVSTVLTDLIQTKSLRPLEWPRLMGKTAYDLIQPLDPRHTFKAVHDFRSAGPFNDPPTRRLEVGAQYFASLINTGVTLWGIYMSIAYLKCRRKLTCNLYKQVMGMGQLVRSIDSLQTQLDGSALSEALQDRITSAYHTDNAPFTDLCNRLRSIRGSLSKFSHNGYGLATHRLVEAQQNSFIDMLMLVGEFDAYLGAARLVLNDKDNSYCMVSYVSDSDQPVVEINNFWNPFINADTAIANSVALGTTENSRNMVLTGPNAGGKSTALKAITLSVLLAQAYGIAPAKSMKLTPFTKICSSLKISDDLARGNSLFKAEVLRAKELKTAINGCAPNEFIFSIVDELFTGTVPTSGEYATQRFIKLLAAVKNSMCIFATHFIGVTDLAQEHSCINMRVGTPEKVEGKLVYPFTLEEGIAQVNVANDILEAEGLFLTPEVF